MSKFADQWKKRPYVNLASYASGPHSDIDEPALLQMVGRRIFRQAAVARLDEATDHAQPLDRIVDGACAVGKWAVDLLPLADRVDGFDINPEFVEAARARARETDRPDNLHFEESDAVDYDYDGADLVVFGGCLMYLRDEGLKTLMQRLTDAQEPGDFLYVRATVSDPNGERYETEGGVYRLRRWYRDWFDRHGYDVAFDQTTMTVVVADLLSRLAPDSDAGALGERLDPFIRGYREEKRGESEFVNWIAVKR